MRQKAIDGSECVFTVVQLIVQRAQSLRNVEVGGQSLIQLIQIAALPVDVRRQEIGTQIHFVPVNFVHLSLYFDSKRLPNRGERR